MLWTNQKQLDTLANKLGKAQIAQDRNEMYNVILINHKGEAFDLSPKLEYTYKDYELIPI